LLVVWDIPAAVTKLKLGNIFKEVKNNKF
jgi:hypothetical protein